MHREHPLARPRSEPPSPARPARPWRHAPERPRPPTTLEPAPPRAPRRDEQTPVSEIMTRNAFCATPEMSLAAIAYVLVEHEVGGAPVVDPHGRPIGMISKSDVLRELARRTRSPVPFAERTALDAMTPLVFWLPEEASIAQAAALMAYERVHRIPVVTRTGKVAGVVSTLDVLRWIAAARGYHVPR